MDELGAMQTFAKVGQTGSFSEVARQTEMSISSILRQVNALEERVGVRLLRRSTRKLALTEAGKIYLDSVCNILHDIEAAKRCAMSQHDDLSGVIRVHAHASAGAEVIVPALPGFLQAYPQLRLDLTLTDARADLLGEHIDLAVWLDNLEDSNIVARRLAANRRLVCASPGYFERHGRPAVPGDLLDHNCLIFRSANHSDDWHFRRGGSHLAVPVSGNLKSASAAALLGSARAGLGVALLPDWMVRNAVRDGALQTALQDFEASPTEYDTNLYVVYPHRQGLPRKVRHFMDFLIELFDRPA